MQSIMQSIRIGLALAGCTLLVSSAIAQVGPGPHTVVYNGYSRGWSTTAQAAFQIGGLDLPLDAQQAGDTAAFLVVINGVQQYHVTGVTTLPHVIAPISIIAGDIVRITGNWSPAAPGNFTAHNSYSTGGGTYSTTIAGTSHTLFRAGQQWDIGDPAFGGTGFQGLTGSMGRVFIYDAPLANYALKEKFGSGCYDEFASFYENFGTPAHDLSGLDMTLLLTGTAYTAVPSIATFQPTAGATALILADDSEVTQVFSSGNMPLPDGTTTNQLTICSNGFISVSSGNGTAFTPSSSAAMQNPVLGWYCWHDYNSSSAGSGQVMWEETATHVYVTWDGVWSFGTSGPGNVFQFQFDKANGHVAIVWVSDDGLGNGHVVGYSPGGASLDPGSMDISAELPNSFSTGTGDNAALAVDADARPVIGTTINVNTDNIPAGAAIAGLIFGLIELAPPLDLTAIGMPGCFQYCSQDSVSLYIAPAGSATSPFTIPNDPALSGVQVKAQSASLSTGANALGAISSNGLRLTVDMN